MLVQMLWGQAPGCLLRSPRPSSAEPLLSHMAVGAGLPLLLLLWPLFTAIHRSSPVPPDCPWRCAHVLGSHAHCLVPGTPAMPPGLSLHVSTMLLGVSSAHVHALLSHQISLTNPHSKTKFKNWESFLTHLIKVFIAVLHTDLFYKVVL